VLAAVLLVGEWEEEETIEQADVLDTHRQRMLLSGDSVISTAKQAKDWAVSHLTGDDQSKERHASAYLRYHEPPNHEGGQISAWYHTLVPKHSADDTYFAVEGTGFGYMGLQQVRDTPFFEGKVVFSLWDQGGAAHSEEEKAQIVECGVRAICTRFGGEGTGAKSYVNFYKWTLESEYGFLTRAFDLGGGRVRYEGWFHAEELHGWRLISKIEVRRGTRPWSISGMYSFTEQWSTREYGEARWQKLGPSFVRYASSSAPSDGDEGGNETARGAPPVWSQIREATFDQTRGQEENTENVNANVTNHGKQWGLGIGGHVSNSENKLLQVDAAEGLPEQLTEFDELERTGKLPHGCEGHTCSKRWWIALVREALSSSNLLRTGCLAAICLLSCIMCCCVCCPCCSDGEHAEEHLLEHYEHDEDEHEYEHEHYKDHEHHDHDEASSCEGSESEKGCGAC